MADLVAPHFELPFRFSGPAAVVIEQDSDEEIIQGASVVVRYERGTRTALPEFGVPDYVLRQGGVNLDELEDVIVSQEPRASVLVEREGVMDTMVDTVTINLEADPNA